MKLHLLLALCTLHLALAGCRGPIRNPAALTPFVTVESAAPPTSTTIPTPTAIPTATPIIVIHTVQEGDTLYGIALQYGITVEAITATNNLPPDVILNVGDQLRIPL